MLSLYKNQFLPNANDPKQSKKGRAALQFIGIQSDIGH